MARTRQQVPSPQLPNSAAVLDGQSPATELLADHIIAISTALRELRSGRLNDRAIELLVTDACTRLPSGRRIGVKEVRAVLDALASLDNEYIRRPENVG